MGNSREGDSKINTKQKKYAISALPVKNLEKNPHMRKRWTENQNDEDRNHL